MEYTTVLFTLLATALSIGCQSINESSTGMEGFGYELLLGRMDYFENSMKESQAKANKQDEMILKELKKLNSIFSSVSNDLKMIRGITSCRNAPANESGIYTLKLMNTAFDVYCEQKLYGGGWVVIQNRFDGSVDFYRQWKDYRNGFGSMEGEFWIGLEKIYLLTSSRTYELMVHMEDFDGVVKYAYFPDFKIEDEQKQYELNSPTLSNGTAGDSLNIHRGDNFSTHDRDYDRYEGKNLAVEYHAGWWHGYEYSSNNANLNGKYANEFGRDKMHWKSFTGVHQGLKVSKMMIREL